MLESYVFLAQIPDDILLNKQKEVIANYFSGDYCIYFISDGFHTKIGISDDPISRMNQLQTGNPRKLILIGLKKCGSKEIAVEHEKRLHKDFESKNVRGEWFFLTDSDIHTGKRGCCVTFTDYFVDPIFFERFGFYKETTDIQRNINDRLWNSRCKKPYYPQINKEK